MNEELINAGIALIFNLAAQTHTNLDHPHILCDRLLPKYTPSTVSFPSIITPFDIEKTPQHYERVAEKVIKQQLFDWAKICISKVSSSAESCLFAFKMEMIIFEEQNNLIYKCKVKINSKDIYINVNYTQLMLYMSQVFKPLHLKWNTWIGALTTDYASELKTRVANVIPWKNLYLKLEEK